MLVRLQQKIMSSTQIRFVLEVPNMQRLSMHGITEKRSIDFFAAKMYAEELEQELRFNFKTLSILAKKAVLKTFRLPLV